ncbi:Butyrate kinase 2 [Candidatus Izimaplasma bacterium HR1]|jgi:butyrate kinase|uniref:butyrate kinase n=1 Tax=Candidatus Izimoplasma sp. HR1 TaxID=1541959 RepID=UPI0004F8AF54|nr:Butyrate kinase 2 [Candidatus Izimaplasma bacterium HR1]
MINLTINPGSTSTKIAVFDDDKLLKNETIRHSAKKLKKFEDIYAQLSFRKKVILEFLKKEKIKLSSIDGFIGRGGLMKPVKSGIYQVTDKMVEDLSSGKYGNHASNLGGLIAKELADEINKKAYIADPVVVDEMSSVAKISGLNGINRRPLWHALNQKAVARKYANNQGKKYEHLNLIVAHLGGGISVGLHKRGRVTDVNNALNGDGPFSPERTGGLPVAGVYELAFSGQYSLDQIKKLNHGFGGLVSYLNTNDAEKVSEMISEGHVIAKRVMKAMVYQIAKEIGGLYAVTRNNLDAIIITGGLAYNQDVIQPLLEYLNHLGEIVVYPGEDELEALNFNLCELQRGILELKTY